MNTKGTFRKKILEIKGEARTADKKRRHLFLLPTRKKESFKKERAIKRRETFKIKNTYLTEGHQERGVIEYL